MPPGILTMIGMTATILIATWTMNRSLRLELREAIQELRSEIKEVRIEIQDLCTELKADTQDLRIELKADIQDLREAQHGLNERMAGVEGLVTGLKEAIVVRAVA